MSIYFKPLKFISFLALVMLQSVHAARAADIAAETFRPQVHFSPQRNWTNDPNGLVYFEGEYHLFFQYNPFGDVWGHMSWGHAVSPDLLHWHELPLAIAETDGEMVFTGSVVVDEKNSSGLCLPDEHCLVAIYTGHRATKALTRQTQNLAVSHDRGRTWQRYADNPVLDLQMADFRDPSVSWNDKTQDWLMAVSRAEERKIAFYSSADLKHWVEVSRFGPTGVIAGQWECPDLLNVPFADGSRSIWALKIGLNPGGLQGGSGEQYFLGDFDGKTFRPSTQAGARGWTDYGKDNYCAISYNHLPAGEKPILLGWMSNWQYADKLPTKPWRGQMTVARRLSALEDEDGLALIQEPVIAALRQGEAKSLSASIERDQAPITLVNLSAPAELLLHFNASDARNFGLRLYSDASHYAEVGFNRADKYFYIDRTHANGPIVKGFVARTQAPLAPHRPFDLHLVIDRSSIEAFAQGGTIAMTNLVYPLSEQVHVELIGGGGTQATHVTGQQWSLDTATKSPPATAIAH